MRTSVEITNQEVAAYTAFCRNHHVFFEGEEGVDNGNFVRDYFLKTWGEDIRKQTWTRLFRTCARISSLSQRLISSLSRPRTV